MSAIQRIRHRKANAPWSPLLDMGYTDAELKGDNEWPEERLRALVEQYEQTDQLALEENLNDKTEWL